LSFKSARLHDNILILFFTALITVFCVNVACARMVTDETGRCINVISPPQRIVSLAPGITETLYALGLENKIAGVTTFCNWPAAALGKTRIGGFTNPSIERIVSLKPDLIIATADGNRKDTVQQLEELGLPVYVTNPSDTRGVLKSIQHIGEITGRGKEARIIVKELETKLNNIADRVRHKRKPRVFFQIGMEPIITAGKGTLINEVIERAGGINVAGRDMANYPRYSAEGIIGAEPDIIIFAPMVHDKEFKGVKKFWRKFGELPAVRNNRIYPMNADLINRASPRIVDAVEIMASILHPDKNAPGKHF